MDLCISDLWGSIDVHRNLQSGLVVGIRDRGGFRHTEFHLEASHTHKKSEGTLIPLSAAAA